MKRRQAGFTLTELLVVVSIIGVLATLAIVYMRPHVRTIDIATRFGDLVREASRRAVALGPVRADVALARGSRARTEVTAAEVACTRPAGITELCVQFTGWRVQEAALPAATWTMLPLETFVVDPKVRSISWVDGVMDAATAGVIGAPGVPTAADVPNSWVPWVPTGGPPAEAPAPLRCFPNGTCTARTLFFQSAVRVPNREEFARVSVMPLGGAITTRADWN
jgi:prepilin-type N-terminal cleavage/methylation domain-containing protein